ncbi:S9 family peptidase [Aestuariivirga litoralis]|uniref:S9 family peptidase n=1 Tax=Aestuariivirga litoralis TaxID=2650924 RepID=UPI0018C506D9|nr:S9 family peptidase [Aestuariivirga litoralis]MBG1232475.1 S9 family peptidase [Aestuariivirga litoralis]
MTKQDLLTLKTPPICKRVPSPETWHGHVKQDDYKWLKAANWQEVMHKPEVLAKDIRSYLEAENKFAKAEMADTAALQKVLFKELKGRIKQDDSSVPAVQGAWTYHSSYKKGGQYPLYWRKAKDAKKPELLFDGNALAKGKKYFSMGSPDLNEDQTLAAWSFDDNGSEFYEMRVRDLKSGKDKRDRLKNTTGDAAWAMDGKSFFYTVQDDNHRPLKTYRHELGAKQADDKLVFNEKDTGLFTSVGSTASERFIKISIHDHENSEVWLIDAAKPKAKPRLVVSRSEKIEYDLQDWNDRFIIRTNAGGAEDYKIMEAPVADPSLANWKDLIPHRPGIFIVSFGIFQNYMVRLERENALPRIVIREMKSGAEHAIAFDEEAYSLGFGEMREFDTETLRFTYSSPTTPGQVFDYNMRTRERVLRKTQEIPSGHDPSHYVARRVMAPAHDGELIPVTLLYKKTTKLDGTAPLWLYGYGSYGLSMPAGFNTSVFSLVNRGFVYAIAHVRGGQEKGRAWYKKGKLEHKTNTFKDFISSARYLIAQKFTSEKKIVAQGGSAGGMLMGAVANMAPEVFGGIVAEVPFVDVLTTMLDDTLPLTPPEWPEWGNPIADKKAYETIASYSPVDNVAAKDYPHIFAIGGLTDPRVTYWEPAKWVANLRAKKTDKNLLLLKTIMSAGHGGASGRFDQLKEVAEVYAFGLKISGKLNAD